MNPFDAVPLERLRTRTSMKWQQYPPDVLPLWVAEMDVDVAEPVTEAVCAAMRAGDTGYPQGYAYAEAYSAFASERWGWTGIDPARTALVADVMTGVTEVIKLVTDPDDTVVLTNPVYAPFYSYLAWAGRRVVEAPLDADHRLDLDALDRAFAGAAAFLLCNPQNPTGTVHTRAELEAVAALAARHGVRVVVDEIHAPLVLAGATHTPYLDVAGAGSALAVFSASKAFNLAGLKAAVVVAGPEAADDLARLPEVVSHGPSHVGAIAHIAALRDGGPWLDDVLAGLDRNRDLLVRLVAEKLPVVRMRRPAATYLAWLDFRAVPGLPPEDPDRGDPRSMGGPAKLLVDRGRVALSAGAAFGTGGVGHARLNFGTSAEILEDAVGRIATALA